MYFDNLIKFYASHHYYKAQSRMVSTHLYLYKHVLNDMGIHFQKRKIKSKTLKTYIFVKLFNQDEAKDETI
jgi:hypothetical protein